MYSRNLVNVRICSGNTARLLQYAPTMYYVDVCITDEGRGNVLSGFS